MYWLYSQNTSASWFISATLCCFTTLSSRKFLYWDHGDKDDCVHSFLLLSNIRDFLIWLRAMVFVEGVSMLCSCLCLLHYTLCDLTLFIIVLQRKLSVLSMSPSDSLLVYNFAAFNNRVVRTPLQNLVVWPVWRHWLSGLQQTERAVPLSDLRGVFSLIIIYQ